MQVTREHVEGRILNEGHLPHSCTWTVNTDLQGTTQRWRERVQCTSSDYSCEESHNAMFAI